jgi:hypothetical protein
MDSYIVRIYRRGKKDPRLLVGLVEEVGCEGRKAFTTLDDLWAILMNPGTRTHEEKKSGPGKRRRTVLRS